MSFSEQAERAFTPHTLRKRAALQALIERLLAPEPAVQAVLAVGSIATGRARADSDIDAVVWLDPFDPYIVPAEFIWRPSDGSFHSIFGELAETAEDAQFDLHRLDLAAWREPRHVWPDGLLADLSTAWWAYTRTPAVAAWLAERIAYPAELSLQRVDEALVWLDQLLDEGHPERVWQTVGPQAAHDRLWAAYDWLAAALFACQRRWRPWRNREMEHLLALPWLPAGAPAWLEAVLTPPGEGEAAYAARVAALRALYGALCAHLQASGAYGEDPISEAFVRAHDEPGRAWNMDAWQRAHDARG